MRLAVSVFGRCSTTLSHQPSNPKPSTPTLPHRQAEEKPIFRTTKESPEIPQATPWEIRGCRTPRFEGRGLPIVTIVVPFGGYLIGFVRLCCVERPAGQAGHSPNNGTAMETIGTIEVVSPCRSCSCMVHYTTTSDLASALTRAHIHDCPKGLSATLGTIYFTAKTQSEARSGEASESYSQRVQDPLIEGFNDL